MYTTLKIYKYEYEVNYGVAHGIIFAENKKHAEELLKPEIAEKEKTPNTIVVIEELEINFPKVIDFSYIE